MSGLMGPIGEASVKHISRLLRDSEYRTYVSLERRLRKIARFKECSANVHGWNLSIPDSASFLSTYKEIFVERIYAFKFAGNEPRILDLGANIGLSVLYFKHVYRKAHITAFEADPKIFSYLVKNVHDNGYTDVQLINKAMWHENTVLKFRSDDADGGYVAFDGDSSLSDIEAIDIRDFLMGKQFDLLKMDIEGAEEFVLPACKNYLDDFKYVFVEYHSKAGRKQCLDRLISILAEAGFRLHIHSVSCSTSPFFELRVNYGYDLQLNIFAWKE